MQQYEELVLKQEETQMNRVGHLTKISTVDSI